MASTGSEEVHLATDLHLAAQQNSTSPSLHGWEHGQQGPSGGRPLEDPNLVDGSSEHAYSDPQEGGDLTRGGPSAPTGASPIPTSGLSRLTGAAPEQPDEGVAKQAEEGFNIRNGSYADARSGGDGLGEGTDIGRAEAADPAAGAAAAGGGGGESSVVAAVAAGGRGESSGVAAGGGSNTMGSKESGLLAKLEEYIKSLGGVLGPGWTVQCSRPQHVPPKEGEGTKVPHHTSESISYIPPKV